MLKICKFLIIFLSISHVRIGESTKIINLNQHWTLWNNTSKIAEAITLPSGVYSVLQNNGKTESVLYSTNDVQLRWIAKQDWQYELTFDTPLSVKDYLHAILTFHGIDTFATISLNGRELGKIDNMYVRYRFEVKDLLRAQGSNTLVVTLSSPIKRAIEEAESSDFLPPPKCLNSIIKGECHGNMIRKLPISFGSEFSPAVPSMGIWKSVELELYNTAIIRDVTYDLKDLSDVWSLEVCVYFELGIMRDSTTFGSLSAEISVESPEPIKVTKEVDVRTNVQGEFSQKLVLKVPKKDVELWWPTGHGQQKMYILQVEFQDISKEVVNKREWKSYKLLKVGFRKVELIEQPIDTGNSFYFKINGKPIFMKGANFVPLDILPEFSYDETKLRHLLRQVKLANMNMLRVYAGGYYESDQFYSIADDLGIMIWQEAIFPPAMYQKAYNILQPLRREIRQNVRRIQHHPSLIHWSTNNQNELAIRDNRFGTQEEFEMYKENYYSLYHLVVWDEIKSNDPSRSITVSSPSNGIKDSIVIIGENPQDPNYGDVHVFPTNGNLWEHGVAPRARFVSAFGFQSLPSVKSCNRFRRPSEEFDQFFNHRQHQVNGSQIIEDQIKLNLPPIPRSSPRYWDYFVYASEISQVIVVTSQIDTYRIEKGRENSMNTMGAILWQLNDVWTAPSWSAIEQTGRTKVLWNAISYAFYPEIVVGLMNENNQLDVYIVNDEDTMHRYHLIIRIYRFSTLGYSEELIEDCEVEANQAKFVKSFDVHSIIQQKGGDSKEYFIKLLLRRENSYTTLSRDFVFLSLLKDARQVQSPRLLHKIATEECDHSLSTVSIEIKISRPALYVTLDVKGITISSYWFSTNGYTQVEPIKIVHLYYQNPSCEMPKLRDSDIQVMTMNDILLGV